MNEPATIPAKNRYRSLIYFVASLVTALVLTWFVKGPGFTDSQVYALFLLFFAVSLWITEAIPPFAVSLFILAYLVFTFGNPHLNSDPEKIDRYVNTFSSSIIWLLLGGFFMAAAMRKTGLDTRLLSFTLKISGKKSRNILIALMVTSMVASMLMSDSATTSMVVAAIMPLLKTSSESNFIKALVLGISIAAAVGGMGTIIANSTNPVVAGLIYEGGVEVTFSKWILYGLPISIALTAICCYVLIRLYLKKETLVSFDFLKGSTSQVAPRGQRAIVLIVIIVTILFWLTGSVHRITVAATCAIPIVVLTVTGILTSNDIRTMPWDSLLLVAGGLSLGEALKTTGILDYYTSHIRTMGDHPILFILILSYFAMLFANVGSSTAACMLLIPLGMSVLPGWKMEVGISIGLSSACSVLLPASTPPNVIVYSTGLLKQKDFRAGGLIVGILGPVLVLLWALLLRG
jgi:solute carrier family 13 (sodium-dependent dicarboxylate transporter), member 2/3/5